MSDTDLKAIVSAKLQSSLGYMGGRLSIDRVKALKYYYGEKFGNEVEGKSQVVTRDVAEAIDSVMPSLMKVFFSGDEIGRFEPATQEDEEAAQQATDYVNWIFTQQNNGYKIAMSWFKDALMQKVGTVKSWWEETDGYDREQYEGLTDDELKALLSDEAVELQEKNDYPAPPTMDGQMEATQGENQPPSPMLHDVVIHRSYKDGKASIVAVPPDEFLTDRRAVDTDTLPFSAHRTLKTETDLLNDGYSKDVVDGLPWNDDLDLTPERQERFKQEDEMPQRTGSNLDKSMKQVWISECYMQVDYNGDGKAEFRRITVAGDASFVILDNEETDDHPFSTLCPNPMPHKLFGESLADKTMDIQLVKSTIVRNILDSQYQSNSRRVLAVDGQVNLDDLLSNRTSGVVRVKSLNAVAPLEMLPIGSDAYQMVAYMDQTREGRTGVKRSDPSLTPDAINKSATEANIDANRQNQSVELIARTFAETGIKHLFRRILELVCKHQQKPKVIKLRGKWVTMDPSTWNSKMDMTVSVGLGTGNKDQEMQHLMALLPINEAIIAQQGGLNGPLLTAPNVYNQLKRLVQAMGLRSVESYYTDPANAPPPAQPKPDPAMAEIQGKLQLQQQQMQADQAMQAQKMQGDQQTQAMKLQSDHQLQQAKIASDSEASRNQAIADAALKQSQMQQELMLKREQLAAELQLKREQLAAELELKRELGHAGIMAKTAVTSDVHPGGQPG